MPCSLRKFLEYILRNRLLGTELTFPLYFSSSKDPMFGTMGRLNKVLARNGWRRERVKQFFILVPNREIFRAEPS